MPNAKTAQNYLTKSLKDFSCLFRPDEYQQKMSRTSSPSI